MYQTDAIYKRLFKQPLRVLKTPIGKLYIIAHASESGIGEIDDKGSLISSTVEDLTQRMKQGMGELGKRKPESVEMLSCYGGGSPKTMGSIGEAVGAPTVRAPVQETVISARIIKRNEKRLTAKDACKSSDDQLNEYIQKTDALQYYDFVPGVPHLEIPLSREDKLQALRGVVRHAGAIPYVSFNAEPGKRDAVPYWKAHIEKRLRTDTLPLEEELGMKGVIEVNINEPERNP